MKKKMKLKWNNEGFCQIPLLVLIFSLTVIFMGLCSLVENIRLLEGKL